jgi:pyrroloquinoline-quinone synthase
VVSGLAWDRDEFSSRLHALGKFYHIHHPFNVLLNSGGANRDHDGCGEDPGGIESWLRLALAVGLTREATESLTGLLPGVRFAVDAYVNFARREPWPEAVCSSLTELFAPQIHLQRLANWPRHYPWIDPVGLHYFQSRVSLARRDVEFGLDFTLRHFDTRALQERALDIVKFKLDVLWQMSDAMALHFRVPP